MTEPAFDLDALPDLDFARYAPQRRRELVCVQPRLPQGRPARPAGELEVLGQHIVGACRLIGQCIRLAAAIIWRRAVLRLVTLYHRIAQSLNIAWALAGFGWGGFVAFPVIIHFVR
jgi:hypothetical protein